MKRKAFIDYMRAPGSMPKKKRNELTFDGVKELDHACPQRQDDEGCWVREGQDPLARFSALCCLSEYKPELLADERLSELWCTDKILERVTRNLLDALPISRSLKFCLAVRNIVQTYTRIDQVFILQRMCYQCSSRHPVHAELVDIMPQGCYLGDALDANNLASAWGLACRGFSVEKGNRYWGMYESLLKCIEESLDSWRLPSVLRTVVREYLFQ
jgi:hypothetical protein